MPTFWEIIASNALLVTVLALVLIVLGRVWKHAASMHVLWVLVLLKLFIPPVYTVGIPTPATPQRTAKLVAEAAPIAATESAPSTETLSTRVDGELPWSVTYGAPAAPHTVSTNAPSIDRVVTTSPLPEDSEPAHPWPSWPTLLLCGWAVGTILLGVGCLRRLTAFQRLLRSAEQPTDEFRHTAKRISERLGLRRVPRILVVSVRLSPMVWALGARARVILPKDLVEQLGERGREAILAHELAHVRRCDHVVRWVELLAIIVFWWHPVVWWARRELRELEEQCCDGMVLNVLPNAGKSYAVSLVETLNFLSETPFMKPLAATGAKPGASLARRIAMLKNYRSAGVRLTIGRVLLLLAVAAVPMALALAAESPQSTEKADVNPLTPISPVSETPPAAPDAELAEPVSAANPLVPSAALPATVTAEPAQAIETPRKPPTSTIPVPVFQVHDELRRTFQARSAKNAQPIPSPVQISAAPHAQASATTRKRAIFRLNNAPATDVAETIRALYDGELKASGGANALPDVVISSDVVSNCLLVSASEEDIAQIEEFIKTLDAPKSMVRVEMLIAHVGSLDAEDDAENVRQRLLGLGKSGGVDSEEFAKQVAELRDRKVLTVLSRPQIMTLDNQPAFVQIGEALVGKTGKGPVPGVTVGLTPRIAEDLVLMDVDVEITRAESAGQAVVATGTDSDADKMVPMRRLVTTIVQTTTSVADGRTVILGGLTSDADTQDQDMIVVLTPHIVTQGPRPASARTRFSPQHLPRPARAQPGLPENYGTDWSPSLPPNTNAPATPIMPAPRQVK